MTTLNEIDANMAKFLAAKPKCPVCAIECLQDETNKTIHCAKCERSWTKMQWLKERHGRRRLAAAVDAAANADQAIVVNT